MAIHELYVSGEVDAGEIICDSLVVPPGKKFTVQSFFGEAAFDPNCAVSLLWIFQHDTEEEDSIWTVKGGGSMPAIARKSTSRKNADGVRALALCLDNGLAGPVRMSGFARIVVED